MYCALKCLLNPDIPQNEGGIRPIVVIAPEGSYFNPRYGAGCGARAMNSMRIAESVLAAMAPVCRRAVAPYGGWSHYCFGGLDPRTGRRVVGTEILAGGHGARLDKDGIDFLVGPFNINNLAADAEGGVQTAVSVVAGQGEVCSWIVAELPCHPDLAVALDGHGPGLSDVMKLPRFRGG